MGTVNEKRLHKSVCKFKKWAKHNHPTITEDDDNGEWELGSYEFDEMCDNIIEIIKNTSCRIATEQMIEDILYGIAIDFWNRNKFENDEYQKIMVLHVLYKINSPKLKYYLDLAEQSEYKWLKENSIEIREKLN